MRAEYPLLMAPSGTRDEGFLLKNPMFWLILWLQNVASWTFTIILIGKGKYLMDGSVCGLCLTSKP